MDYLLFWGCFIAFAVIGFINHMSKPWNNGTDWAAKNDEIDTEIRNAIAERRKEGV